MGQRLPSHGSRANDRGRLHQLGPEARPSLPDLEFHDTGISLRRTFADAHERPTGGFGDRLIFPLCPDARRIIVIVLNRFAAGDDNRPFPRLSERCSRRLRTLTPPPNSHVKRHGIRTKIFLPAAAHSLRVRHSSHELCSVILFFCDHPFSHSPFFFCRKNSIFVSPFRGGC